MTRAEEAALEYNCALCNTDVRHCGLRKYPRINCKDCNLFILGYEQAEKDLALSLEQVVKLDNIIMNMVGEGYNDGYKTRPFYEEVLKRFNEQRKK